MRMSPNRLETLIGKIKFGGVQSLILLCALLDVIMCYPEFSVLIVLNGFYLVSERELKPLDLSFLGRKKNNTQGLYSPHRVAKSQTRLSDFTFFFLF